MKLQSFHCPSCAARLDVRPGAGRVKCDYCGGTLVVEQDAITHTSTRHAQPAEEKQEYPAPDAVLFSREAARFEMSVIEQRVPEGVRDLFSHVELADERFAIVYLRIVDDKAAAVAGDLDTPFGVLKASLEADGDPGLAVNVALEGMCKRGFQHRLEAGVLLFEPRRMTVTSYDAGCRDAVWWVSNEHGQCSHMGSSHAPLERKFLREARDYFSNNRAQPLAAGDLVVFVSAGFAGRGGRGMWPSGSGVLTEVLNGHLGEEPLRIVTLAKNSFWEKRNSHHDGAGPPVGDVKIAAVRAIPPELAKAIPGDGKMETHRSRKYEVSIIRGPKDRVKLTKLHSDRMALIWMSPAAGDLSENSFETGVRAILETLDGQTGDNDNPRCAGREAYEAMKIAPETLRMCILHLSDQYGRVKYYTKGWKRSLSLGVRGIKADSGQQQFDEGGEATVPPGDRLFFPGPIEYEGDVNSAEQLGFLWEGGKASRLFEALCEHWKTKKTDKALEQLAKAAASDAKMETAVGMAVVTGLAV